MLIFLPLLLCFLVAVIDSSKTGCPEPIDVKPCTCTTIPFTYIQCLHLDNAEVLRKVFYNSSEYAFKEVHIEYSALQFLPHDVFEQVPVTELHLRNVTVSRIFDQPPVHLEKLDIFHIEQVKLIRGFLWWMMEPLKNLRILKVYSNDIKIVGAEFNKYVTKELQQISFYDTKTKIIKPDAFKGFVNLDYVEFVKCHLTNLSRNIFPTPFNGKYINLNNNNIKFLPDDMFTSMPKLITIALRDNVISVLPASAFPSHHNIAMFALSGNPLICDCRMAWIFENKPLLTGTCQLPTKLQGTALEDLQSSNFRC